MCTKCSGSVLLFCQSKTYGNENEYLDIGSISMIPVTAEEYTKTWLYLKHFLDEQSQAPSRMSPHPWSGVQHLHYGL